MWSNVGSIVPNRLNMHKPKLWDALGVATSFLNKYIKLDPNWTNIG